MKIGIVIVNFNGAKYQNDCIESILKSSFTDFEIIICDNGSTDNSMQLLEIFSDERIIKIFNNDNLGVAAGNNVGIRKSIEDGCAYTLLLNNDTILERTTIEHMINHMEGNFVVVPKIYYFQEQDKYWFNGGKILWNKGAIEHFDYQKKETNTNIEYCDYAPTCCMLVNNEVFKRVGFMDEDFFVYCDDTDFCIRLYNNDIKIKMANDTRMYHKVSMSTGGELSAVYCYYANRNRFYLMKKYKSQFKFTARAYVFLSRFIKYIFGLRNNNKLIKIAYKDYKNNKMGRNQLISK